MLNAPPLRFRDILEFVSTTYGDSVKDHKAYGTPEHHFLFYIKTDTIGNLDVRRMWDYRIGTNIADSERTLFHLAKGPKGTPAYLGRDFIDLLWRFPCYMTFVLDNLNWKFNIIGEPITFREEKDGVQYHPNHSFYNGVEISVPILNQQEQPTGEFRQGLRVENHIKADDQGNDLGPTEKRRYKMDLQVLQPNASGNGHTPKAIDPDGQNQGPPGVP